MEAWRRYWDGLSLGARFRVLFLLAYVPVLIAGGGLMIWLYQDSRESYFQQVHRLTQLAYTSLDRWYHEQISLVTLLATAPAMRMGNSPETYRYLHWIAHGHDGWQGVSLIDAQGRVILSSFQPYGSPPVDLSRHDFVRAALASGKPTMSSYTTLPLDPRAHLTLVCPFKQGASIQALAIHYDPTTIANFFAAAPFQGKFVVTMIDAEGRRLSRPLTVGPLGEPIDSSAIRHILAHPDGESILTWSDGVKRITAYIRHEPSGWIVLTGLPVADSLGMIRRMLLAILALGILGFGLVFWMLQVGIRITSQPITLLVDRARRLGDGDLSARIPPLPTQELQALGRSFNQMAEEIERARDTLEAQVVERTQQLRQALSQLKSLDRLKDHFLSTISHEMKTPLSLIIGYTELLQDKYPDEELLKGIQDGSRRLTSHINNMLDYSALLGGGLPLYMTEVSVLEAAANALQIMETEFKLKNLQVVADLDPTTPPVRGDSRRITQMILELLDNARKFTPPGGTVGVEVGPLDGRVRIVVWDTGVGIQAEDCERIWEAFRQITDDENLRKGGLGLGLTIVKKLAELHHGSVTVESQPGKGSRFTIDLPAEPD